MTIQKLEFENSQLKQINESLEQDIDIKAFQHS